MKRSSHGGGDAPMLGGQPVERGYGLVVAQDDRDLAAGLTVGGGAGCPVFGLHGSDFAVALGALGEAIFQPLRNFHDFAAVVVRQLLVAGRLAVEVVAGMGEGEARGAFSVGAVLGGQGHFSLRSVGPIPTMCLSYPVTSDTSTTVRRLDSAGLEAA